MISLQQDEYTKHEYKRAEKAISELGWKFLYDMRYINNGNAPLFRYYDFHGQANKAAIIIDPGYSCISCEKEFRHKNPLLVRNILYALWIPGDISGKGIINILTHPNFLSLVKSINENWSLEWNGRDHVGELDKIGHSKLTDFYEWLSTKDHELGEVGVANDDLLETKFYDKENNEVDYYDDYEKITSITLLGQYILSPATDTELLIKQITENFPEDTEIHELEEYIDLHYAHICQNVTPKTIQDWA